MLLDIFLICQDILLEAGVQTKLSCCLHHQSNINNLWRHCQTINLLPQPIKITYSSDTPEPGRTDFHPLVCSANRLWHSDTAELDVRQGSLNCIIFPTLRIQVRLPEKTKASQTSWHLLPLIYCSLLSMWFPPICFRCLFAFTPWKQTAFSLNYSYKIPPHPHPLQDKYTSKNQKYTPINNSSLKDITDFLFLGRYSDFGAHAELGGGSTF